MNLLSIDEKFQASFIESTKLITVLNIYYQLERYEIELECNKVHATISLLERKKVVTRAMKLTDISDDPKLHVSKKLKFASRLDVISSSVFNKSPIIKNRTHR